MKKNYIQPTIEVMDVYSMDSICAASVTKSVNVVVTPNSFYDAEDDFK